MNQIDAWLNGDDISTPAAQASRPSGRVGDFVESYMPLAQKVSEQIGVAPDIILGQWGLETGWGRSVIPGTNNLGNIKDPTGRGVRAYDRAEGSNHAYMAYQSPDEFGDHFSQFVSGKRYEGAVGSGSNETEYFTALKRGGYATDPDYISKGVGATNMVRSVLGGAMPSSRPAGANPIDAWLDAPENLGGPMRPVAPEEKEGFFAGLGKAFTQGVGSTSRSVAASYNTVFSNLSDVELLAQSQQDAIKNDPAAKTALMQEINRRREENPDSSIWGAVKDVAGAAAGNLEGTAQLIAEQAPNAAISLGTGWAGAKLGAMSGGAVGGLPGAAIGGTLGFIGGMLFGNTLLETGGKAMEKSEGGFTSDERDEAIREGAVKAGVITAVDAATLGAGRFVAKAMNNPAIRAGARAEAKVLADAGVDIQNPVKVAQALRSDQTLMLKAKEAGEQAAASASTLKNRAATGGTLLGMETAGEFTGEYAGEYAATGKADPYDAAVEAIAGFAMSAPEAAWSMSHSSGNNLDAKGIAGAASSIDPLQKVREAADKGGVLSKAAMASSDAAPVEGPIRARIDALKADAPTILDALRKSNNPETAKDFVDTMNQAQNPSFSPDMREQMVSQMEAYAAHAKAGVVPGMVLSRETGLSVPPVEQQEQQPAPTDGPLIDGQKVLPDPNVIDVDGRIVDVSSEPSSGQASPTSQPAQAPVSQGVQLTDEVFAPRVAIPADTSPTGDAPAGVRKRKAQIDALAKSGLTTIQKTDSGFVMVNPSTGQYFRLSSPADIAMARNAASVYAQPKGAGNDTGANQAGNRGSDQGVGGGLAEESATTGTAENASPIGQSAGTLGTGEDAGVVTRYSASPEDVNALSLSAKKRGLSVSVEAPPQDAVTGATTRFLQALEKLTGKRGIAVKVTGKNAYDGVQTGKKFYVNVDNPQTSIPFTIAHEFKHMGESFPGLNRLYERMWDRIPEAARREYAKTVEGVDYDSMTPEQMDKLKSEMVADFIGRRFNDRQWLQRLAKEKPNLFAEFVRDWVRLLDSLIGEIKSMLGVVDDRTEAKQIDTLMRNHLKQLEEMKSIAIEVAVEWAKQNPGLAKKSGVNYSTRGYDANAEQDGILSKNRIDGTSGRLDQDSGRPDGQARDGRPDVLGEAGAQRLAVLQPSELRIPGGRGARDGEAGGQAGGRAGYGRSDAQAESGSRNLPEKTERRGFYGQPQEGSVEVTGIHFSQQPRDTLISDFYGTGLKGAERERLSDPKNSDIRPRIYFYVSRGKDIVRESGVGNVMHKVTLRNLYDVTADDLDIVASTRGKGLSEADKSSAWERAVMNAGFDGYVVKDPIQPQWYAVLVGKHQVQPSLDPKQVAEAAEMSKPKPKTRREGDELVATPDSTETVPLIHIKPKINEGAPSFRFQWGAARVLASEADMANAIIESEGLKFKFNMRNSLPEGNAKRVTENLMSDNYKGLDGVMVEVDGKTVDAKQALEQIDRRKDALDMVLECLI